MCNPPLRFVVSLKELTYMRCENSFEHGEFNHSLFSRIMDEGLGNWNWDDSRSSWTI